jgi:site-specific recombinase XerD
MGFVESNDVLVKSFLNYLKMRGCSINTQNGYERDLQKFFETVDNKLATEMVFKDINPYFLKLVGENKAPRTLNRKIAAIRCFFKFLLKNEYITTDPSVKLESSKLPKRLPEYMTDFQVRQVMDAATNYRDKVIMMVLYTSGARLNEIYQLNKESVDFQNKRIITIGKGNKQEFYCLNSEAVEMLQKYLEKRTDSSSALFVNKQGQRIGKRYIQRMLAECGEKVGIKGVHPHLYRHTLASRLAMEGIQIQTIQSLLHHASINTTQMYAHLNDEKVRGDYDKIFEKKN